MLLFLDFDGVLHHESVKLKKCGPTAQKFLDPIESKYVNHTCQRAIIKNGYTLFEHAERLVAVLAPYPHIQIVLSTSWREHFRPHRLLSFLPAELAHRVIGQTPVCDDIGGVGSRLCDIHAYIEGNNVTAPWIAIDDQPQLFWDDTEDFPPHLYYTRDEGLTPEVAADFARFLALVNFQTGYIDRNRLKELIGIDDDRLILPMFEEFSLRKMMKLTKKGV
jgi:hypothetical protein